MKDDEWLGEKEGKVMDGMKEGRKDDWIDG